jgi:signal transduction histidine kinase
MFARARARYARSSIRTKLSLHLVVSATLFVGLLLSLVLYIEKQAMLAGAERAGFRLVDIFARSSVQAVIADDYLLMQHVVNGIASDPEIRHAMILTPSGEVLAHSRPGERGRRYTDPASVRAVQARGRLVQQLTAADGTPIYDFAVPVTVLNESRATARVAVSIARELNALQRTRNSIILFACGIVTFGLAWATYQTRRLTRPIRALVAGAREVRQGNLGHRLAVETHDELGEIAAAFNAMTASLEAVIEDLRRSHEALAAAQDETVRQARMVAIGELSAAVAHEIRNPLGALSNCVQMLRESPHRQPDDAELLAIVYDETVRLEAIVSDFLAFGRPRPPHLTAVDVQELLQDTANLLRRDEHRSAAVTITLRCPPKPVFVRGDRDQLRQVFLNLFVNACDAMGKSGGTIEAIVGGRPGTVEITVSDSGPGIPAEALARVFEPFFTTRGGGTGLGLAIVWGILEAHRGTVTVASPPQRGAVFTCVLPAALPDDESRLKAAKPAVVAHG